MSLARQHNWQLMLLSLVLSAVTWFFVSGRARVDAWLELPVQFLGAPENLVIQSGLPNRINVRVRGPQGLLRSVDARLNAVSVDLSSLKIGANIVELRPENIPLSKSFEIMEVTPQRLTVRTDRFAVNTVSVQPRWDATLHEDWQFRSAVVLPEMTEIRGPAELVNEMDSVETQIIEVNGSRPGYVETLIPLSLPAEVAADPAAVQVRLLFAERRATLRFSAPVVLANATEMAVMIQKSKPQRVMVQVEVPVSLTREKEWIDGVTAQALLPRDIAPGMVAAPYRLTLPGEARLLEATPEVVELHLVEAPRSSSFFSSANASDPGQDLPAPPPQRRP